MNQIWSRVSMKFVWLLLIALPSIFGVRISDKVYFDMSINGVSIGRIVFGLFGDLLPLAAKNFRELATDRHHIKYKGSKIHRVVKKFMMQGGDFSNGNGTGDKCIYGEYFIDEGFFFKHSKAGLLALPNKTIPNTNSSQFFITFGPNHQLDGKHVIFGAVLEGMDVVRHIENAPAGEYSGVPQVDIVISDCGILELTSQNEEYEI